MTIEEYYKTNWHRGNEVKLNNGKVYLVKGTKGHRKFLLLYSAEYDANFVADYRIIDCRTSDYEEPEEVYLEKRERKRRNLEEQERIHQEALARKAAKRALMEEEQKAKAKAKAEKDAAKAEEKAKAKAEAKAKKAAAKAEAKPVAKPVAKAEPVATAEPASEATGEQPKRKRKRIGISRIEKVLVKFTK